jgi:hypothetical protein
MDENVLKKIFFLKPWEGLAPVSPSPWICARLDEVPETDRCVKMYGIGVRITISVALVCSAPGRFFSIVLPHALYWVRNRRLIIIAARTMSSPVVVQRCTVYYVRLSARRGVVHWRVVRRTNGAEPPGRPMTGKMYYCLSFPPCPRESRLLTQLRPRSLLRACNMYTYKYIGCVCAR